MLLSKIMNRLGKVWRGPGVQLTVDRQGYHLGHQPPRVEVVIHDSAVLRRMAHSPSLAFGEGYMQGRIEVRGSLIELLEGVYLTWPVVMDHWPMNILGKARPRFISNSPRRAVANARHHYDIGNDFYRLWLDPTMTYSCAYFMQDEDDVATAQQQKLELLCRKARLEPGQRLLDIGCGWGSLVFHAAQHHGVHATGLTPANEQADHIQAQAQQLGLSDRIQVLRGDWRDLRGRYDRIISVGMFEHVGLHQYRPFLQRWADLLADGGLSVLHTIGRMKAESTDPWINRYIFPGGYLPTLSQITSNAALADLKVMDVENLRQHYARTLAGWSANYQRVWDQVVAMQDEPFARMWWLYLQGAQAAFRWGDLHLWQSVIAKDHAAAWPLDREVGLARA